VPAWWAKEKRARGHDRQRLPDLRVYGGLRRKDGDEDKTKKRSS
jgi:hypothetical protein